MTRIDGFNPGRLVLARQRRGWSKKSLADSAGLSIKSISNFESGESPPTYSNLCTIAKELDFPVEFFFGPEIHSPSDENASFRSFSRMTASQRNAALASGGIAYLLCDWISERFELPATSVPDCTAMEPEIAADTVRTMWGLGQRPISNMIHLVESKGVKVFSLAEETNQVNAFSCWREGVTPYIFLNTMKSSEASRFDAAHELGHLVLHRHGSNKGKEVENEANAFASAFLMPRESILANGWKCRSTGDVIRLKKTWNVSAMALCFRLHKVGILSEWVYRSICIELSTLGARTKEIDSSPRESSQILQKILGFAREKGLSVHAIANELNISTDDLKKILFGLAPIALDGKQEASTTKRITSKTILQLVK